MTIGTALYQFDDLPERMRRMEESGSFPEKKPDEAMRRPASGIEKPVVSIESLAVAPADEKLNSRRIAVQASRTCLEKSQYAPEDIELLIAVGIYKSDYVAEPSNAALFASKLNLNDDFESEDYSKKSFAFDLSNGSLGWINAAFLAQEQIRASVVERVLIVASEAENNKNIAGAAQHNLAELGTASLLHPSQNGEGFSNFHFETFGQYIEAFRSAFDVSTEKPLQIFEESDIYESLLLQCLRCTLTTYLKSLNLKLADLDYILGPQISPVFDAALEDLLNAMEAETRAGDRLVSYESEGKNLFTSSQACGFSRLFEKEGGAPGKGEKALILAAGSGIQIGCALYQF